MLSTLLATWLATAYVVYVVTRAALPPVQRARDRVVRSLGEHASLAYLVTCPWCSGFYLAGAITGLTWWWSDLEVPLLVWLSSAAAAGLFIEVYDHLGNQQELDERTLETLRTEDRA